MMKDYTQGENVAARGRKRRKGGRKRVGWVEFAQNEMPSNECGPPGNDAVGGLGTPALSMPDWAATALL